MKILKRCKTVKYLSLISKLRWAEYWNTDLWKVLYEGPVISLEAVRERRYMV